MKRLINLEGIDCSGKSTLARMLADRLGFQFDHEPTFDSDFADRLNFGQMDCWRREFYFMKDRMLHQEELLTRNTVLDRYVLSGLAYAEVFSPEVVQMMKSIYGNPAEFKEPDLIVLIDMDPVNAVALNSSRKGTDDYNEGFTVAKAQDIRNAFLKHLDTMREWEVPFCLVTPYFGDIDRTFNEVLRMVGKFLPDLEGDNEETISGTSANSTEEQCAERDMEAWHKASLRRRDEQCARGLQTDLEDSTRNNEKPETAG